MEPERDIEKQLKAYAKKRREEAGAPMKMHPATRRMLQSEATRLSGKKGDKPDWRNTLYRLWPRLALTGSIFVLLAIGSWALLFNHQNNLRESESKYSLALKRENVEVRSASKPASRNAPVESPAPDLTKNPEPKADRSRSLSLALQKESASTTYGFESSIKSNGSDGYSRKDGEVTNWAAPAQAAAPSLLSPTDSFSKKEREQSPIGTRAKAYKTPAESLSSVTRKQTFNESKEKIPASAAAPPAAPVYDGQDKDALATLDAPKLGENQKPAFAAATPAPASNANRQSYTAADSTLGALGGTIAPTERANTVTQRYSRIKKDFNGQSTLRDARKNIVLDNFWIEQSGHNIRVVDGDGSTYTGSVQTVGGKPASLALSDELSQEVKQKSQVASANKPQRRVGGVPTEEEALLRKDNFLTFSVSGTNRTLNQSVVFTGGYDTLMDDIIATNSIGGITNKAKIAPSGSAGALVQPLSPQVRGEAIIGGTNQIKIDAVRIGPK